MSTGRTSDSGEAGLRKTRRGRTGRGLPPILPRRVCARVVRAARAFTLLEMLVVLSVLAILASITLVVGRGVSERSKIAQARAELAALAAALEQYKQHFGDYPSTPETAPAGYPTGETWDGGVALFNALCGNLGPNGTVLPAKGRAFVDLARFTLDYPDEDHLPRIDDPAPVENWFNDPWGKCYSYVYRKGPADAAWKSKGYLLYSHGPDRDCDLGQAALSGLTDQIPDVPKNRDNIYHGRD